MGDILNNNNAANSDTGKARYGIVETRKEFNEFDWFRFGMYIVSVAMSLVAIFIEPVNAVWVEPFTRASNVLAAVASGTAITHIISTKGDN